MKGRVVLFGGYFVGMLLVASWLTGIFQDGLIGTSLRSSVPLRHDTTPAVSGSTELTAGEVGGEVFAPVLSDSTRLTTDSVEGPRPGHVERPTAPPPHDQTLRPAQWDPILVSGREAVQGAPEAKLGELERLEERLRRQRESHLIEERWLARMKSLTVMGSKGRDAQQEAGIMKLARLYEGMEPETAASLLGSLDKALATHVLASMKDRQAAKVLGAMNGSKAKDLSERLHDARPNRSYTRALNDLEGSARTDADADR